MGIAWERPAIEQNHVTSSPETLNASNPSFSVKGLVFPARRPAPGLYVVATPIGNLGDITFRGLEILASADIIFAEDTRVTRGLLTHFGIASKLLAAHEHNERALTHQILTRLAEGQVIAMVSDAGTPLVSDPGAILVTAVREAGYSVFPAPGASALLAAVSVSPLGGGPFFFEGFAPTKSGPRRARLAELKAIPAMLVFYESPRRVGEFLQDCRDVFGQRQACVARELTKIYEEFLFEDLSTLATYYQENEARGEVVVMIAPPSLQSTQLSQNEIETRLAAALQNFSTRDAADLVAGETGENRKKIYALALRLAAKR